MKTGTTLFLKAAVILMGVPILGLCIVGLPWLVKNPVNAEYSQLLYPIITGMYISVIPFCIALFQAFKILQYIDKSKAFSELSAKALRNIKYSAITISILYVILLPFIYLVAEKDDAPGLILIGLVLIYASMIIAVFVSVLKKLLKEAIEIKTEHDLTI